MPNLVNMVDSVTYPVGNPESASKYDGLYETWRCHAADTRQKSTKHGIVFELLVQSDSEANHCTLLR